MSDENDREHDEAGPNDDAMRALLKRSLGAVESPADSERAVLRGVQKKIRERSKGKFYRDGWSTANVRVNYALIAVVMLVVITVAYFALGPIGITK